MSLHMQLRAAYASSGMTIAEIADVSGVSERTILHALGGRNVATWNFVAIAQALGLSCLDIGARPARSSESPAHR